MPRRDSAEPAGAFQRIAAIHPLAGQGLVGHESRGE
jgi:hypothetical protein